MGECLTLKISRKSEKEHHSEKEIRKDDNEAKEGKTKKRGSQENKDIMFRINMAVLKSTGKLKVAGKRRKVHKNSGNRSLHFSKDV